MIGWRMYILTLGVLVTTEGLIYLPRLQVLRVSLLYETAPVHVLDQPSYLNAAVLARTDLPPLQLLYNLKQIEKAAGRDLAGLRWGPRPLDLDIVFYGSNHVDHESLTIPHERCVQYSQCNVRLSSAAGMQVASC